MQKGKKEVEKAIKKKKTNFNPIVVIVVLLIIAIALIAAVIALLNYSNQFKEKITFSNNIESAFISEDLASLYIKIKDQNLSSFNNSKIKFMLRNLNGTEYLFETNKTLGEILKDKISIPFKKGLLDIFGKPSTLSYDYRINLEEVKGIVTFNNLAHIELIIQNRTTTSSSQPATNKTQNKTKTSSQSSSNNNNPATPPTTSCNNTPWENSTFRCNSGIREAKQTRTLCASGNTEERWITMNCPDGYTCYEGSGAPSEKCINTSSTCRDSDNGINFTSQGFVNISNQISNDFCSLENNSIEYYCHYNGTSFEAKNQTLNCTFGCINSVCLICNDSDNDNYSPDAGACGVIDCNDTNSNVNPGKSEICGNNIDDDCLGGDASCENFGLVAYWKFNDSLDDSVATDETGNYDAACTTCPFFNATGGLNSLGAYEFNGINNYLTIPAAVLNNNTYSISLWIKPASTGSEGMIIYSDAGSINKEVLGLWFAGNTNSILVYNKYGLGPSLIDSIMPDTWINIILTYNYPAKQAKVYVNGILKTSDDNFNQTETPLSAMIGAEINNKYFNGSLNQIKVYNRILTNEEITALSAEPQSQLPSLSLFERIINWFKKLF